MNFREFREWQILAEGSLVRSKRVFVFKYQAVIGKYTAVYTWNDCEAKRYPTFILLVIILISFVYFLPWIRCPMVQVVTE